MAAAFPIRTKLTISQPPDMTIRAWREFTKEAHREQGEHFHRVMLPKHFLPGADRVYGYRRRKRGYRDRLDPSKPSTVERAIARGQAIAAARQTPLVFSGLFRRAVTSLAQIRAYPSRVTILVNAPSYVPSRPRTDRNPPVAEEATKVLKREERELEQILYRGVMERLRNYQAQKTVQAG